jgi:hypothetical protein
MNLEQFEPLVPRDPKVIYDWIIDANADSEEVGGCITNDIECRRALKSLCLLFCDGKISFAQLYYNILNYDVCTTKELDPRKLLQLKIDDNYERMSMISEEDLKSARVPGWNNVFKEE